MPAILFVSSYLLDIIILILLIVLIFALSQLLKSLGRQQSLIEKLKISPELIVKKPANSFDKYAKKDKSGTYLTSYNQHKKISKLIKRIIQSTLVFLIFKVIIILVILNIPRPGEAQPQIVQYKNDNYLTFLQGAHNLTEWDQDGLTLKAGQYFANYLSQPIGSEQTSNQWQNLSWQADKIYNQRPVLPQETIASWTLDSLESCSAEHSCQNQEIELISGIYNSSAYYFKNSKSKVKVPQNINFNGSFTISAWIKPEINILNGNDIQDYVVLAKGYGDYLADDPYELKYSYFFGFENGSLTFKFWTDDNKDHWVEAKNTDFDFDANRWYQIATTYDDQNKTLKLYIDSIEHTALIKDYDGNEINHSPNIQNNYPTWIGSVGYRWLDNEEKILNIFEGVIDEVYLINRTLNILEIRDIMNQAGEIYFQVRTGDSLPLTGDFIGPNNKTTNYFTNHENNDLTFLNSSKYLQYLIYFSRPNTNFKPKLFSVTLDYLPLIEKENNLEIALETESKNNRFNIERDFNIEKQAIDLYIDFFKELPATDLDWEFVNMIAYQKTDERDLSKEEQALSAFINYMKNLPITEIDWGIVKALAYTLKGEILLENWLNLK